MNKRPIKKITFDLAISALPNKKMYYHALTLEMIICFCCKSEQFIGKGFFYSIVGARLINYTVQQVFLMELFAFYQWFILNRDILASILSVEIFFGLQNLLVCSIILGLHETICNLRKGE